MPATLFEDARHGTRGGGNVETVRVYWETSERGDLTTAGQCIGDGYTWIDHTTDFVARSPDELLAAGKS